MNDLTVVIKHGTADAYEQLACRCPPCTGAWTGFLRGRTQARAARTAARRAHRHPEDGD